MVTSCNCQPATGQQDILKEPSGVIFHNGELLIVDDEHPGKIFHYDITKVNKGQGYFKLNLPTKSIVQKIYNGSFLYDLESIDIFSKEGQVVVLSEQLNALVSVNTGELIVQFPSKLSPIANRGLEGLAIKSTPEKDGKYQVAVVWEGGYPWMDKLPPKYSAIERKHNDPYFAVFDIDPAVKYDLTLDDATSRGLLVTPKDLDKLDEPDAQRFRASDLVWYKDGFIVLLVSENSPLSFPISFDDLKFLHQKLVRFDIKGNPVSGMSAININDQQVVEDVGLKGRNPNWEGLCWYEENEKLLLVFDKFPEDVDQVAIIIDIPKEWK